ncbi:hypothetical protein NL676_039845 [Syzygium grande]|nr:hypothetical protein NL676_039845 [Syzygium grande]
MAVSGGGWTAAASSRAVRRAAVGTAGQRSNEDGHERRAKTQLAFAGKQPTTERASGRGAISPGTKPTDDGWWVGGREHGVVKLPTRNGLVRRNIKVGQRANMGPGAKEEGSSPRYADVNGSQNESKLELFGFDSLVNILGLKR